MGSEVRALKQSTFDALCQNQSGKQYIIQMQVAHWKAFVPRAQFYAAKAYCSQMQDGQLYSQVDEIIFIAITDFIMFPQNEEWKSDRVLLENLSGEENLKNFSFSFIELPKFKLSMDQLTTRLEKWVYFIKHAEEFTEDAMERFMEGEEVLIKASKQVNRYNLTQIEMNTYEAALRNYRDALAIIQSNFNKGFQQGLQEGRQVRKMVQKLKEEGVSIEKICQIIQLSPEEVAAL